MSPIPTELRLYSVWVVWTGLTGLLVAIDLDLFRENYGVLLQVLAMIWVVYAILSNLGRPEVVFLAIPVGGLVQIGRILSGAADLEALMDPFSRLTGTNVNPNSLGFLMVWSVVCSLFMWQAATRVKVFRRVLILAMIAASCFFVLASGSRKSAVALGVLLFVWSVFGRSGSMRKGGLLLSLFVGGAFLYVFLAIAPGLAESTSTGYRFRQLLEEGSGDVGEIIQHQRRFEMYANGLALFLDHPVFGVGLNNFGRYFYSGQMSHSDYMEPLATTGLVGFVLYQAFYVLLIRRAWNLLSAVRERNTRYRLKAILMGILAIMIIGLGSPHYTNVPVFLMLTAFSAYTWRLQRNLRRDVAGWSGRTRPVGRLESRSGAGRRASRSERSLQCKKAREHSAPGPDSPLLSDQ
ncbi:MAG: O-antigen ligase family protein [Armatimonadetes bacterium]|nr:O-antigen ligase family protein [Armatimonadota bacterium]